MSYIGNSPALKYASFAVQHFTTSATTGYTLDNAVTNENDIRLVINNVVQQPGGSYAYTASGTTLTLSAATTGSDTMYCVFIGKAVQTVNPPVGSVDSAQLATDAVTQAKMADDSVGTAEILDTNVTGAKLNDDAISAQDALGAAPADTDEFLVSDAGTLKRVDYSYIKGITQTSFLPNAQSMIINGDMQVNQRGTSSAGVEATNAVRTADRWWFRTTGTPIFTQTTEALTSGDAFTDGFSKSLKVDVTTADASLAVSDQIHFRYSFEGQDVQLLKKGTANAEKITVAFWIKATKTGTNILELYDESSTNRHCSAAYTVSSTNTWEYKIVTFPADTAGTALANTNAQTLDLYFWIAAGTNYTSGTLQTTWIDYSSGSTRDDRAVGQVNNADSTSNNFEITGVQLEVGEYVTADLPPFRHESYGDNLARCQRYYQTFGRGFIGKSQSSSTGTMVMTFPVHMRATPTCTVVTGSDTIANPGVAAYEITSITGNSSGPQGLYLAINTNGGSSGTFYLGTVDNVGDADAEI
jgi:hypothetical protein